MFPLWQEAGVVVIVSGAVWYLAKRLFGRPPQKKTPATFVPLAKLKAGAHSGEHQQGGCH